MMMNLFSVFDPCTGTMSLNWLSSIMFVALPSKMWMSPSKISTIFNKICMMMFKEMNSLTKNKSINLITISLFLMILINNIMGLMPYVYTSSAHLVFSLTMALPLWISMMMFGWMNLPNKMLAHLVPTGTPSMLMPFMVMIETISNVIRPGSLSVRLSANMIAGHLLMSLLGNNMVNSTIVMSMLMWLCILLLLFESAVAMIQAYVFMTLSTLYSSEI
nr:ATP synthase F0 subunit 6 [Acostemma sp.]